MNELTRAREYIHATEWAGDLRRNLMNAIGAGRVLAKRITELERINTELLAACRMARQYPAAITTELALDAAISKAESEGE